MNRKMKVKRELLAKNKQQLIEMFKEDMRGVQKRVYLLSYYQANDLYNYYRLGMKQEVKGNTVKLIHNKGHITFIKKRNNIVSISLHRH